VVLTFYGCGHADSTGQSEGTPIAFANERPLQLQSVTPGSPCPESPQLALPTRGIFIRGQPVPKYGYGPGPLYLTGQVEWHRGEVAIVLSSPAYIGPVVVRGHQVDGGGGFPFGSPTGQLYLAGGERLGQWRMAMTALQATIAPGCYEIQMDGTDFSEQIVFKIQAGAALPD
jgi:hypothetical protein